MEQKPLFIAFSTQKGGVGKTAFTVLYSYLHYQQGKSIAVVDCDFPQRSIMEMRKRDQSLGISADSLVLVSILSFASSLNKNLISVGKSSIKGMYLFWTMAEKRHHCMRHTMMPLASWDCLFSKLVYSIQSVLGERWMNHIGLYLDL